MLKKKRNAEIEIPEIEGITDAQKSKCHKIIHSASAAAAAAGGGLAQVPCSDAAIITPIQVTMTIALGKVFHITLSETAALAAIGTGGASMIGRAISQVLVGWIPVIGNGVNAGTAAAITEALGWLLVEEFSKQ